MVQCCSNAPGFAQQLAMQAVRRGEAGGKGDC